MLVTLHGQALPPHTIVVYAPTSEHSTQDKEGFYEALVEAYRKVQYHGPVTILGDFNARILAPDDSTTNLGPHLLKPPEGDRSTCPLSNKKAVKCYLRKAKITGG